MTIVGDTFHRRENSAAVDPFDVKLVSGLIALYQSSHGPSRETV